MLYVVSKSIVLLQFATACTLFVVSLQYWRICNLHYCMTNNVDQHTRFFTVCCLRAGFGRRENESTQHTMDLHAAQRRLCLEPVASAVDQPMQQAM